MQIIKDPICPNLDGSQSIDMKEAIFLGFALSSDSIGSGIGFSILGANSLLFPLIAACFQLGFLSFQMFAWRKSKINLSHASCCMEYYFWWFINSGRCFEVLGIVTIYILSGIGLF